MSTNVYRVLRRNLSFGTLYRYGAISDAGGKWAEKQKAQEDHYFSKKTRENVDYIKTELKKGRSMESIMEDLKKSNAQKEDVTSEKKASIDVPLKARE